MKTNEVTRVGGVSSVAASGHHRVNGQRVRAQHDRLGLAEFDVERVPQASRRVGGGNIQGFKVKPVALDFGTVGHGEAHAHEYVLKLSLGQRDESGVANRKRPVDVTHDHVTEVEVVRFQ